MRKFVNFYVLFALLLTAPILQAEPLSRRAVKALEGEGRLVKNCLISAKKIVRREELSVPEKKDLQSAAQRALVLGLIAATVTTTAVWSSDIIQFIKNLFNDDPDIEESEKQSITKLLEQESAKSGDDGADEQSTQEDPVEKTADVQAQSTEVAQEQLDTNTVKETQVEKAIREKEEKIKELQKQAEEKKRKAIEKRNQWKKTKKEQKKKEQAEIVQDKSPQLDTEQEKEEQQESLVQSSVKPEQKQISGDATKGNELDQSKTSDGASSQVEVTGVQPGVLEAALLTEQKKQKKAKKIKGTPLNVNSLRDQLKDKRGKIITPGDTIRVVGRIERERQDRSSQQKTDSINPLAKVFEQAVIPQQAPDSTAQVSQTPAVGKDEWSAELTQEEIAAIAKEKKEREEALQKTQAEAARLKVEQEKEVARLQAEAEQREQEKLRLEAEKEKLRAEKRKEEYQVPTAPELQVDSEVNQVVDKELTEEEKEKKKADQEALWQQAFKSPKQKKKPLQLSPEELEQLRQEAEKEGLPSAVVKAFVGKSTPQPASNPGSKKYVMGPTTMAQIKKKTGNGDAQ